MSQYTEKGIDAAKTGNLDAAAVRSLDYREVAALCGVIIERNGDSPTDFFYEDQRAIIAATFDREAEEARAALTLEALKAVEETKL
jgi:hypothetical protein